MTTATSSIAPMATCLVMDSSGKVVKKSTVARQVCQVLSNAALLTVFSKVLQSFLQICSHPSLSGGKSLNGISNESMGKPYHSSQHTHWDLVPRAMAYV